MLPQILNNRTLILNSNTELWRYDIIEPPQSWIREFHNPEYFYDGVVTKNVIGAYFFYEDEKTAIDTGIIALKRLAKTELYITEACTSRELRLLNLRNIESIFDVVLDLFEIDIDIMVDEMIEYSSKRRYSEFRETALSFNDMMMNSITYAEREELKEKFQSFWPGSVAQNKYYFLQQLTDFNNGEYFRNLLLEKDFAGYTFNENSSATICIFDSNSLCPKNENSTKQIVFNSPK